MRKVDFKYTAWTLVDTVPVFKLVKTTIGLKDFGFDVDTEIAYTYNSAHDKWGFEIYGEFSPKFGLDMITEDMIEFVGRKKRI